MKTHFTFIFIIIGLALSAQEYKYVFFPDSDAVWSEMYWGFDTADFHQYALFNEDTIINGITYHQLFHNSNLSTITPANSKSIVGIREDSQKRVWAVNFKEPYVRTDYQNEKGEVMLYNFSLHIGDTIKAKRDHVNMGHGDYMVVKQIDSLKIHKSIRKVFSFEPYPWVKWIEGIGNIQGLIFSYGDLTAGGYNNRLRCMHQNDTLLYIDSNDKDCIPQFVIDGINLLRNSNIKVYPNPASGSSVYFENLDFDTLELFNSDGNLVRFENIKGIECFELDIFSLPLGSYYYSLKTKGLAPTKGKLILQ